MNRRSFLKSLFAITALLPVAKILAKDQPPEFGVQFYELNQEINPPHLRCWKVVKGFPRKHNQGAL